MIVNKYKDSFNVIETSLNEGFWSVHYSGWENSTFDYLLPLLDINKTFIDIGAWIGPISLIAQKYSKQCICFEPDPVAFEEFSKNIELNEIKNIILENKAVSIHDTISIGCETLGQSGTRDSCDINKVTCTCISISQILEKYNLKEEDISVIKIDIEGHESELLQDYMFMKLNVPMHISLHPVWKTDKLKFFRDINPFFIYKNIDMSKYPDDGFFDIIINKSL